MSKTIRVSFTEEELIFISDMANIESKKSYMTAHMTKVFERIDIKAHKAYLKMKGVQS